MSFIFIDTVPLIWPDEAFYADFGYNFWKTGRLINLTHPGFYEVSRGPFIYPPLLLYLFGFLYKIFGFSIYVQRGSAIVVGLGLLLLLFWLVDHRKFKYSWLLFVFLLLDWVLMRTTRVSRPEIFILFFTFSSYFIFLYNKSAFRYLISGSLLTAAVLLQSYGIIGYVVLSLYVFFFDRKRFIFKLGQLYLPLFVGAVWWLFQVRFDYVNLIAGLKMQAIRKSLEPGVIEELLLNWSSPYGKVLILYLILTLFLSMFFFSKPKGALERLLLFGLVTNYALVFLGKQFWYYAYPLVYLYLLFVIFLEKVRNQTLIAIGSLLMILIVFCNLALFRISYGIGSPSYKLYTQTLYQKIPPGKSVFLTSLPDPYFGLQNTPKNFTLYEFPPLPTDRQKYYKLLDLSDYVVYTDSLDLVFGDLLKNYLEKNMAKTTVINNGPIEYTARLIQLVPRSERKH